MKDGACACKYNNRLIIQREEVCTILELDGYRLICAFHEKPVWKTEVSLTANLRSLEQPAQLCTAAVEDWSLT